MSKTESKKRSERPIPEYLQEQVKKAQDFLTPFQNGNSSAKQSWFHDLAEWYAKVLFPNLERNNELVESVRKRFWAISTDKAIDEKVWGRLTSQALNICKKLEEQHALLDQNRKMFERVRLLSHDLSGSFEVFNSELEHLEEMVKEHLVDD